MQPNRHVVQVQLHAPMGPLEPEVTTEPQFRNNLLIQQNLLQKIQFHEKLWYLKLLSIKENLGYLVHK